MAATFWDNAIIIIFFFYGLAFYSLGLALLVESGRASELGFARSMRLLAGFGLLHGIHEWIDMVERGLGLYYNATCPQPLCWVRLAILVTSFLALLAFGEHLLARERYGRAPSWRMTLGAAVLFAAASVIVRLAYGLNDAAWLRASDVLARYIIGIPGAVVACLALWRQRAIFRQRGMGGFARDLTWAALALGLYGVVGQLFTGTSVIFPSTVVNSTLFLQVMGFPVQLFRAAMATVVAFAMIRVLRALEVENQQRLNAIEHAKLEAERRSREELARLNAELQAASEETARLLREVQRRDSLRGELIKRITAAQEAERQRIARELHDEIGQTLTGLALGLRGLANVVHQDSEQAAQRLADLEKLATDSLGELRHLITDLRPPQLDDMGLVAALRFMVDRIKDADDLQVRLEVQGKPFPMPPEVETTLFRIAQEALTNILKHARASCACVTINYDDGPTLTVRDDGIGFDLEAALSPSAARTAWGLVGMQERANLINAVLRLESAQGQGTTLTCRLNILQPEETQDVDSHSDRG